MLLLNSASLVGRIFCAPVTKNDGDREMKFNPKPAKHPMDIPREVIEKCFVIVASGTDAAAVLSA